jgi:hypothetical protein
MKFLHILVLQITLLTTSAFVLSAYATDSKELQQEVTEFRKHADQKSSLLESANELLSATGIPKEVAFLMGSGFVRNFICSTVSESLKVPGTAINAQLALGITLDIARIAAFYHAKAGEFSIESAKKSAIWLSKEYAKRGVSYGLSNVGYVIFNTCVAVPFPVGTLDCKQFNDQWGVWAARASLETLAGNRITALANYVKQKVA